MPNWLLVDADILGLRWNGLSCVKVGMVGLAAEAVARERRAAIELLLKGNLNPARMVVSSILVLIMEAGFEPSHARRKLL